MSWAALLRKVVMFGDDGNLVFWQDNHKQRTLDRP